MQGMTLSTDSTLPTLAKKKWSFCILDIADEYD